MKNILFLLLLLLSSCAIQAQRRDLRTIDGVEYLVNRDTTPTGVISVQFIPVANAAKELESALNSVLSNIAQINEQITALQAQRAVLNRERRELEDLQTKLNAPRTLTAPPPTQPANTESVPNSPTAKKPNSRSKKQ